MSDDPARKRFMVIQLVRVGGVAMLLGGLLILAGKVDLPAVAGYVLLFVGMVETFAIPLVLARAWRTTRR